MTNATTGMPSSHAAGRAPILVDVCIVSYRTAQLVIRCLHALFAERRSALEAGIEMRIIVVDNDSGDADAFEPFVAQEGVGDFTTIIRAERNGGYAYGNNLAMRYSYESGRKPDYFWLLNPDTLIRPRSLIELVEFAASKPTVGIAGSALFEESGDWWPYTFRFPSPISELHHGLALGFLDRAFPKHVVLRKMDTTPEAVDWLPGVSMLLRREVVDRIGGMDESYFLYYEETDYCRRLKEAGYSVFYVPKSEVMHFPGGSTGVTTKRDTPKRLPGYWYESRRRYFQKNFGLPLAIAADVAFVGATAVGALKNIVKGDANQIVPHQIRDVVKHSPLRGKNRTLAPVLGFHPTLNRPR